MITVEHGDLLRSTGIDAIVNAVDETLNLSAGVVSQLILAKGGASIQTECTNYLKTNGTTPSLLLSMNLNSIYQGPIAQGGAMTTAAGKLPFKNIIHAVSPGYRNV